MLSRKILKHVSLRRFCSNFVDEQYFGSLKNFETPKDKFEPIEEKTVDILEASGENYIDEQFFRGQIKPRFQSEEETKKKLQVEDLNFIDEQFFGQNAEEFTNSEKEFDTSSKDSY